MRKLAMQASIKKCGNTLVVRLNKGVAKGAGVTEGTIVRVRAQPGRIVVVDMEVAVGTARTLMARPIRASAESGGAFHIRNDKNAPAATVLLINPKVREQRLSAAKQRRTLGDLIDTLPFKRRGAPRLVVDMANDDAPALRMPGRGRATEVGA